MRPGRIYLKIFFSFLALLVLAEALHLGLFLITAKRHFPDRLEQDMAGLGLLARKHLEQRLAAGPGQPTPTAQEIERQVKDLGRELDTKVWLTGGGLKAAIKSFEGPIPETRGPEREWGRRVGEATVTHDFRGLLITTPLFVPNGGPLALHLLMSGPPPPEPPKLFFAAGLLVIGLLLAVLVIPVSRLISRPVEELRRSALAIAAGDLGHRAEVRTRDEIGELGRAFNLMADRLAQMVLGSKELLAHVSHELRSPLARISVSEQLLRDKLEAKDYGGVERHLESVREEIGHMDGLLSRLLLLSRLDLQQAPLKRERIDLTELVGQLIARWEEILRHQGLEFSLELGAGAHVRGDGEALTSALSNLLDNAAKYTAPGGRVEVRLRPGDGGWALQFVNTARPLPEGELEAIFQPFHRAAGAGQAGSGLGLALTRKIIEAHGGRITAQSSPQTFGILITLPQDTVPQDTAP